MSDTLKRELEQFQDDSSFHIFHVENPSNDHVSCDLSKISPSTESLTLEVVDNGIYIIGFEQLTT